MKTLCCLFVLYHSCLLADFNDPGFFETEKFQEIKSRYCAAPVCFKKRDSLERLKEELCKGEKANRKKILSLYPLAIKKNRRFQPTINSNILSYENCNFHYLTEVEKETFFSLILANKVCDSREDIFIGEDGTCRIRLSESFTGLEFYPINVGTVNVTEKECLNIIESAALEAATRCACNPINAENVSGCLLAIEALKATAKEQCTCNSNSWYEITSPLRKRSPEINERY